MRPTARRAPGNWSEQTPFTPLVGMAEQHSEIRLLRNCPVS